MSGWSYTSTPLCSFMTCTGQILGLNVMKFVYYYYYYHYYHHHHLIYAGYLYLYSWDKLGPREYSVAAILLLLIIVLISLVSVLNLLYFYISTFRSMRAVPNMAVFCSSLTSCFPGVSLTYFRNDFEIVPVAPINTSITFVFTFHMLCISTVWSLYFESSRLQF